MSESRYYTERIRLLEAFIIDIMPVVDLLAEKTDSEFYKALRRRATFLGVVDYAKETADPVQGDDAVSNDGSG